MLFNSYQFIFGFLPVALIVFFLLGRTRTPLTQLVWLAAWSCVFYAYWKASYLFVLLASVLVNYTVARCLMAKKSKIIFTIGICFNVAVIVYFKYTGFLLENFNAITQVNFSIPHIALPLGISFITFQKIAYLTDVYRGKVVEKNFLRYLVFISFFPQLIAGPIVHYNPLMSQFSQNKPKHMRYENMVLGMTLFIIGLAKKELLADTLSTYADPAFSASMASVHLSFMESWIGVLAYTLQIYFDFSGYSDMAVGLARMFGIRLPINFNSPYKSVNIIEFWRRWHITLSHFLRDYVYIPLGGNRKGEFRKFVNLMATMLIGGLWHGANWTFIIWGAIHGSLLTANHLWRELCEKAGWRGIRETFLYKASSFILTFFFVVVAWVFFRMPKRSAAKFMLNGMLGKNGFGVQQDSYLYHVTNRLTAHWHHDFIAIPVTLLILVLGMVWLMPNSQQLVRYRMRWTGPEWLQFLAFKPRLVYLFSSMTLFYACLIFMSDMNFKPFAYFAF
jgi:alginate O-acetyltransferase complex protein AlgI